MGSGKSTIGPLLAEKLGYTFVDLDREIELIARKPIEAIFEEGGEGAFRALEADRLKETRLLERVVVATGGGALAARDTLKLAKGIGYVIYLRLDPKVLSERLKGTLRRPVLNGANGNLLKGEALYRRIVMLLAERLPYYEQAHLILDVDELETDTIAEAAIADLSAQA